MRGGEQFYIDGRWVEPLGRATLDVEDPATEQVVGQVALAGEDDVDRAVQAARAAADGWGRSSREDRVELLQSVHREYGRRCDDLAAAVTQEMGAPAALARDVHVPSGSSHLAIAVEVLRHFTFEEVRGETLLLREPIGVAGLITPWNWPLNQIMCKVAPALATGCTVVLKPSEVAPLSVAEGLSVGDPAGDVALGPVVSRPQWQKVQDLIAVGLAEGARLVTGGPGRPQRLETGHYVRPTVLADVTADMTIAREEVFGPVLVVLAYADLDEAVAIANDTDYGLAAYVSGRDLDQARRLAAQLRAGQVSINGAYDMAAPFGGYKRSGNGRECGELAFHEFLETKAVMGHGPLPVGQA